MFAIQNLVDIQSSRFRLYSFVFERTQSRLVRSTGPIAVARRRSVGRSVRPSTPLNSATNVWIFFKIGGNIPWVNISRRFCNF